MVTLEYKSINASRIKWWTCVIVMFTTYTKWWTCVTVMLTTSTKWRWTQWTIALTNHQWRNVDFHISVRLLTVGSLFVCRRCSGKTSRRVIICCFYSTHKVAPRTNQTVARIKDLLVSSWIFLTFVRLERGIIGFKKVKLPIGTEVHLLTCTVRNRVSIPWWEYHK